MLKPLFLYFLVGLCLSATAAEPVGDTLIADVDYACVPYTSAAGLEWSGTEWKPLSYGGWAPLFLHIRVVGAQVDGNRQQRIQVELQKESIKYQCTAPVDSSQSDGSVSCMHTGLSILFDAKTKQGGLSFLSGATDTTSTHRDSLLVIPFKCGKVE